MKTRSYTRVYLPGGTVAHALDELRSPNQPCAVLCGRVPLWPDLWHGTGSQEEEDIAVALKPCVRCASTIRYQNAGREVEGWTA